MSIFSGSSIYYYFKKIRDSIEKKISSYDYRQLKDFSDTDIETIVKFYHTDKVIVDFDNVRKEVENGEDEVYNYDCQVFDDEPEYINVKGKIINVFAPIQGDWNLLKYSLGEQGLERLNYHDNNFEDIEIKEDSYFKCHVLTFSVFVTDSEIRNKSKEEVNNIIKSKEKNFLQTTKLKIDRLNSVINDFNKNLQNIVAEFIQTKIHDDSSLEFVSDAIGVSVHSKVSSQTEGSKIEILPKKADLLLPDRKKYDGYYLDKENYSAIISTIRNHLIATENNPKAIKKLNNEELIRDTILWTLNANYFVTSGETFRNSGKTDILISFNDKSVYVAECKMWKGRQYLNEGINQLLSYTTWRDSKMTILIFNMDNKDFNQVCLESKKCLSEHKLFKRIISEKEKNYFECEYTDPNNQDSVITISVICANYSGRNE